jgi:hypothetical protein
MVLLVGVVGLLWTGWRRFQRTNAFGVQEFRSYFRMLVAVLVEFVVRVTSCGMVLAGLTMCYVGR